MVIEWVRMTILSIPPSVAVIPISILAGFGIIVTLRGLTRRGESDSTRVALLMGVGFALGILGGLALLVAAIDHEHIVQVCTDSKVVLDPNSQWACPQVLASYWIQWPLAAGLLIPAVLVLIIPSLDIREEQTQQRFAPNRSENESEKAKKANCIRLPRKEVRINHLDLKV